MARVRFIRIDGDLVTVKEFESSTPYEGLKVDDVMDVVREDGTEHEYYVSEMQWDFSHFGDTLVIKILPVNPPASTPSLLQRHGQFAGFINN
jgi:hypothetical protein